ncbi:uncharacterized protein LODBEIA_P56230 [Lodderomyces beijingensis]|uniref:Pseudouridine synthase I TruA alpha/beta domain-containing protein n=1 Tax=Lodderomyces beijingensis TaxID=1775926 RepID=A0ABP0ZTD4_9ASCO
MSTKQTSDYSNWSKEDLIAKIKSLEAPHDAASSVTTTESMVKDQAASTPQIKQSSSQKKEAKVFDWSKHNTRFVALRFAYLGWNYNGLAMQFEQTPLPTIEETILQVLAKVKLVPEPLDEVQFSRCGRTDKGVSAMNQVISINLRSNLTPEEQTLEGNDLREIDYLSVINGNLPPDIKMHSICLRPPPDFDARFSCKSRHYRYLFKKTNHLDIDLMNQAAMYYEGHHDFRNFCKLDGSKQITNFERYIYRSRIIPLGGDLYCFDLQGTAFLWHQVRCMVAILFLVGQQLEKPEIVLDLMDMTKYPTKPLYEMANDKPLVLYDCEFPAMEWHTADNYHKFTRLHSSFRELQYDLAIKSQMSDIMSKVLFDNKQEYRDAIEESLANSVPLGDGIGRGFAGYTPLDKRQRSEDYETINTRWMQRRGAKRMIKKDS